jgi:hypothetical protein
MRQPPDKSTEELARAGRNSGPQKAIDCPKCGRPTKNLPVHIRACDGD